MRRLVFIVLLLVAGVAYAGQLPNQAEEERAIRSVLARFYAGWNAHDPDAMVSIYSDDIDHINVLVKVIKEKRQFAKTLSPFTRLPPAIVRETTPSKSSSARRSAMESSTLKRPQTSPVFPTFHRREPGWGTG